MYSIQSMENKALLCVRSRFSNIISRLLLEQLNKQFGIAREGQNKK